ncbi:MAG: DUF4071 domain-containing protein [Marinobacterium sp.]|nr:DUF4071 domain-containing protein [Marinobacterium sp.]
MAKSKKICFVIMGFGKKTDYSTGKTLDLDKTYKNIIHPCVESLGFRCVRADEIQDSGLIDKSMYALLMQADLVVADISTFNPNAIYELGIRHAVKPFSTIVIKEEEGKIPFDLDHTRIFNYKHLGEDIGTDEAQRCQSELAEIIDKATRNSFVDSPLYDFIADINPPELPKSEYKKIIGDLAERETHIFAIVEKAKDQMIEGNFIDAAKLWEKAARSLPSEDYFLQQQALATYKSKSPSEETALADALRVIEKLTLDGESNDPETLGLTGAIYKRMWILNSDVECLKRAIQNYEKGFQIRNDYYTGENYALCLDIMADVEKDDDEKIYFTVAAKKTRKKIISILSDVEESLSKEVDQEYKWASATLANCYFGLEDDEKGNRFEGIFKSLSEADWEIETYNESKAKLFNLIRR